MTADEITRRLMADRYAKNFVLPRYTPKDWWEMDLIEITPAGYVREYEVKLTRGDFMADAFKSRRKTPPQWDGLNLVFERKHELMADPAHGPCQFYYVTPAGLMDPMEIPDWAGLIVMHDQPGRARPWNLREQLVRPAPRRHRNKIDPKVEQHARGVIYWRWHKLLTAGMDLGSETTTGNNKTTTT